MGRGAKEGAAQQTRKRTTQVRSDHPVLEWMLRRSWSNRAAASGRAGYGWLNGITALLALPASIVAGLLWQVVGPAAPFMFGALMAGVAVMMLAQMSATPATW